MPEKKFPRTANNLFDSQHQEQDYLYKMLDFTLILDRVEDENPHLIPFLSELLSHIVPVLEVDEVAIILKDYSSQFWLPLMSWPVSEALHKETGLDLIIEMAENCYTRKEIGIQQLPMLNGGVLAYPIVFNDHVLGVLFVFVFEALRTHDAHEALMPPKLQKGTPAYNHLVHLLWYINELENDAIAERIEMSEAQSLFARYMSPEVMANAIYDRRPVNLGGQEADVTVLFADVCGFTKLAETLSPTTLVNVINTYFSHLVDIVFKYEGTLDKFIGDCVMVVFNSPLSPQEDHHVRACMTALEMMDCVQKLTASPEFSPYQLKMSIGINSGVALCGNIGSKDRLDYTVIGNSVNIASRLETHAEPSEILIGESVYEKIVGGFDCQQKVPVMVKGKDTPLPIFRLRGQLALPDVIAEFPKKNQEHQKQFLDVCNLLTVPTEIALLVDMLPYSDRETGMRILNLLDKNFCVEAVPSLVTWIQTATDNHCLSKAIKTIGLLGGAPYYKHLIPFLEHSDCRVTANTIEAIGLTNFKEGFQIIEPFLQHENHRISLQASILYWNENREAVMSRFMDALLSDSFMIQRAAVILLSETQARHIFAAFLDRYNALPRESRDPVKQIFNTHESFRILRILNHLDYSAENNLPLVSAETDFGLLQN
ncbi:MAG: adenylate/guanylate cyclase domain-containing protein [SAR324 cluster bacterium]|nr:adenylate/guanylate cyclase domain-containing protein [SAR324 cluster bacterium]